MANASTPSSASFCVRILHIQCIGICKLCVWNSHLVPILMSMTAGFSKSLSKSCISMYAIDRSRSSHCDSHRHTTHTAVQALGKKKLKGANSRRNKEDTSIFFHYEFMKLWHKRPHPVFHETLQCFLFTLGGLLQYSAMHTTRFEVTCTGPHKQTNW